MKELGSALTSGAGVVLWVAAIRLQDQYGRMSLLVGVLYVIGVSTIRWALSRSRGLGLFLAGGFAVGCGFGSCISLMQLGFFGAPAHLLAAVALGLGALGVAVTCMIVCGS